MAKQKTRRSNARRRKGDRVKGHGQIAAVSRPARIADEPTAVDTPPQVTPEKIEATLESFAPARVTISTSRDGEPGVTVELKAAPPIGPVSVPALVGLHQDFLRGPGYKNYAAGFLHSTYSRSSHNYLELMREAGDDPVETVTRMGADLCDTEANKLNVAALFHVTESMTAVSRVATQTLPGDVYWDAEILPSMTGFLVFEKPLLIEDTWGRPMTYAALSWHREFRSEATYPFLKQPQGWFTVFMLYSDLTDGRDFYTVTDVDLAQRRRALGRWSLCHFGAMADGVPVGPHLLGDKELEAVRRHRERNVDDAQKVEDEWTCKRLEKADQQLWRQSPALAFSRMLGSDEDHPAMMPPPDVIGDYIENGVNIWRLVYTIFSLMDQTVVRLDEVTDRRLARRWAAKRRPPPMVTVIRLRRREDYGRHDETGNWLTYRSVTRGHWRNQPFGPGRNFVKRIWINPYVRGPENAPFHQPQRVSTLER